MEIYKDLLINDFTNCGKCSSCGQCCGDILHLSQKEIKTIAKYVKLNKIKATPTSALVQCDLTCPFRDNFNKKCKIYSVRPEICRVYMCNKTPEEAYRNREFTNFNKHPRSMRNVFFNDNTTIESISKFLPIPLYDKYDRLIMKGGEE